MDVLMPQLGETVAEGKITKWFKSAGDEVKPGDNLFEIETDKVSMEVPSVAAGVLAEIRVAAGDVAVVGAVVAVIADAGAPRQSTSGAAPARAPSATPPASAGLNVALAPAEPSRAPAALDPFHAVRTPERNFGPAALPGGGHASPLARRRAAEIGVDLASLSSSGPHGRILARDVEEAASRARGNVQRASPPLAVRAARMRALYEPGSYAEVPLDSMRRTIATRLVEATQSIPHFYLSAELEIERLLQVREEANHVASTGADGKPSFKLSPNDFIIKAMALALVRVPAANAAWAEDCILRFKGCDIGVAVAIDGGLITPIIRAAETKSVVAISAEVKDMAARARARRLMLHEYQGGATTISNLGMYGIREFSAIINPPQATILAVGAGERRAVEAAGGGVRFESRMNVTLSCDHRVVDGALGAELLAALRDYIEHPVGLMV
ncbi:MAG: 2-oxo acid dehydrogenase subunit E2 [Proteobacteria bacterium]|nr:2-oxo acid dehydrogenase subunit E2 [Pseudomonadota bacterium]